MKISTTKLQAMLVKASRGVGNNKLVPITCLIALKAHDGILTITTTDNVNYLYVREEIDDKEDFYVCIRAEQFSKLMSKMTSEFTTLTIKDNSLEVKGNGKYLIEIPLDELGESIQFPNPLEKDTNRRELGKINQSQMTTILVTVKQGLSTNISDYPYTNYYVGESVIATDAITVSVYAEKLFSEPKLINANMMDLAGVISADEAKVYATKDAIIFDSNSVTVYGLNADGIENYPVDIIMKFVTESMGYQCKVNQLALLQALDRINLFVGSYDDASIRLKFTKAGLTIASKQTSGVETVEYAEPLEITNDVEMSISIIKLYQAIKSQLSDRFEIHFGSPKALKIVDGKMTTVIGLIA